MDANADNKVNVFVKFWQFFKENSQTVSKLLIHQVGLTVFGFLLYTASASAESTPLILGLGIFSAIFYLLLLYVLSWDNGARDKIRIDGGRMKHDPFKGAKVTLIANIPNLLLAVLSLIGYLCIDKVNLDAAGNFVNPTWAVDIHAICQIIGVFINSMYTGIADVIGIIAKPYYLFLICIPAILVCGLGYYFGTKNIFGTFSDTPKKSK